MAKYQKYTEYKDSAIKEIGVIPKHWDISKVKFLAKYLDGQRIPLNGTERRERSGTVPYRGANKIVDYVNDWIFDEELVLLGEDGAPFFDTTKDVAFAINGKIWPNNHVHVLRPNRLKVGIKYLTYSLNCTDYSLYISGSTRDKLNQSDMDNILIRMPSLIEQTQIANFLDYETAKIDYLIEKQQQLIELLKEKRQAVISYLVNVKEGEASIKLKYAVEILAGYSFSSTGFKTDSNDGVALLRGINVGVGNIKWDECVWWSKSDTEGLERYILKKGDLVFGMDRPWISTGARVAEIQEYDLPSYLVQRVARVRALRGFYQPYIKLILGSKEFKSFIESDLTGVSVPHISTDQIISFPIRKLYFEQQVKQTDQAIESINKIDFLIVKAESAIQLMQERRTALISAVVTGKIDVRNWQAPTIAEADTELSA